MSRTSKIPWDESISQIVEESLEAVKNVFQEQISERCREQGGFIEMSKISSQDQMLLRTVEPTLNESCVPHEHVQQRIVKQFHDFAQEFEALFNQQTVIEMIIDSREREAEYNKKVAEKSDVT